MGAPGSGKGTQARFISEEFNCPLLSMSDLLRKAMNSEDQISIRVKDRINKGLLVEDEDVIAIITSVLSQGFFHERGFILDGFPRTVVQASALDLFLTNHDHLLNVVILIEVSETILIDRLVGRFVCVHCGATYHHIHHKPAHPERCDHCGNLISRRPDDDLAVIHERLNIYKNQTRPLIPFYSSKNILQYVDGSGSIEDVYSQIRTILLSHV
jgi:adenylate kinase